MEKIDKISGLVAPLARANVDTDAIMPKQFLKSIKRTGFGPYAFDAWRYLDHGEPDMDCTNRPLNPKFSLNEARYAGASILLTQENFGCGSSREHAPWGLKDYGFKAIIAPSFAEIFYNNCLKNALLPIVLPDKVVAKLFLSVEQTPGYSLKVDLASQTVSTPEGENFGFEIASGDKTKLLEGLDDIAMTLQSEKAIRAYEQARSAREPWIFGE